MRKLRVEGRVGQRVNAPVLDADGAQRDGLGFRIGEGAVGDTLVLALEVGEDGRGEVAAVLRYYPLTETERKVFWGTYRDRPEADLLLGSLVLGKPTAKFSH